MKTFSRLYLWILALIIFLFLGYMINLSIKDKNSKYCKNAIFLLSSPDSLSNQLINFNWTPLELDTFFTNKIIVNQCDKNFFGIPYILYNSDDKKDAIVVNSFIKKDCPNPNLTSCYFFPRDIRFYIRNDSIYASLDEFVPKDSLVKYISYWKKLADEFAGIENQHVTIVLEDNIFYHTAVSEIIENAINVHLEYVNQKSAKLFNKSICDLKKKEIVDLKNKFPFELEIIFGRDFYIQD